jgi:hypothetical protein
MRLLILGESDSIGMALDDPSVAWGNRVPVELGAILGETPETTHVRFYSWGSGAMPYLESVLERGPFDAVVISATKVGFTIYSADNRVRRLLGARAGDWFKARANSYDRKTRWRKPPGWKRSVNELAHKTVRTVIGQAPVTTPEAVTEGYVRAFARIARLEDAQVVVVCAPAVPSSAAKRRPNLAAAVERFRTKMRDEAARRRFDFVDPDALLPAPGPARDALFSDEVHKAPAFHAMLAREVARRLAGSSVESAPAARESH